MRYHDIIGESVQPGEHVYHAAYLPDLGRGLRSIAQQGLRPSRGGYMGSGVYFAYDPQETYYHVSAEEATMFRIRWQDLVNLYGTYPNNPDGIQRDDEQILVPGPVPARLLEVEYFPGEWWTVEDAAAAEEEHGL